MPPHPHEERSALPRPNLLHAPCLQSIPWLCHAFSTRPGGATQVYGRSDDLNLGFTREDDPAAVAENRRRLLLAIAPNSPEAPLVTTRQTHSNLTVAITSVTPLPLAPPPEADGLITALPGIFLGMLTADCVPILVADLRLRIVGVFHAGWRGTLHRIAQHGIDKMQTLYGSHPEDLAAAIGPSIGPCCYTVGEEVRILFHQHFQQAPSFFTASRLDLWEANRLQLLDAGLSPENISVLAQCTACTRSEGEHRFFSHRRDQGVTGRMMTVIGIVPDSPIG